MARRLLTVASLGTIASATLLAGGCGINSYDSPYSLTGDGTRDGQSANHFDTVDRNRAMARGETWNWYVAPRRTPETYR